MQSKAGPSQRTSSSGDDPFIAYNATVSEVLRLGGCSAYYANHGDKDGERLLDQAGAQVGKNPDVLTVLTKFKPWLAREIAAQGKPNPEQVAAFAEQTLRDGAKRDLAQNLARDEVSFARSCDAVRSRITHGDIPLSSVSSRYPLAFALLQAMR
jgi:hypothetical protein